MWDNILPLAVLAVAGAVILSKNVRRNDGHLVYNSDLRLLTDVANRPTNIIASAAVIAKAQEELSSRAGCRVEFVSVKSLTAAKSDNGGAMYALDAMIMNTCTLAQTLESMQIVLEPSGKVSVVDRKTVTPVPAVAVTDPPSAAETALNVVSRDGQVRESGKKIGVGYSFSSLQPFDTRVAAFPHQDVTSPALFGKAPPEIPDNLDFRIFQDMKKEPATDLTNAVAYEQSALSIMYR